MQPPPFWVAVDFISEIEYNTLDLLWITIDLWQVSNMATKKQSEQYGNSSISMLKGEDRVRKRPAVIFGSDDLDVYFQEFWQGKTVFEAERRYLEATLDCVRLHDDFDVLAHLTYIAKTTAHHAPRPVPYAEHRELIDEILKTVAAKGKGLEINTSGVDRCGGFLPTVDYFRKFKEFGGEIVTVGSDAHTASRVGQYSFEACSILKDIFGHVCTFEDRKPIFHKL